MSDMMQARKPLHSHMRWVICALLFWVTIANYFDRTVFGNLAPEIPSYLHLADRVKPAEVYQYWTAHSSELAPLIAAYPHSGSDISNCPQCQQVVREQAAKKNWESAYWQIQMVFIGIYAVSSMLMGRLMDLLGLRLGFACAAVLWSVASLAQSIAPEIGNIFGNPLIGFYICTAALSLGQGANFPAVTKTTAEWFPKRERALATGIFISGSNLAAMLVPLAMPAFIASLATFTIFGTVVGWRGAFFPGLVIDAILIVGWLAIYRRPAEHPRVSEAELAIINSDGPGPVAKLAWRKLLPHRQTWAFVMAKFLTDGFWWFYLFGAADFFHRKFGLSPNDRKYLIMTIYVLAVAGSIGGGWLTNQFAKLGWTINRARKTTLLICALLVSPVFLASLTSHQWVAAFLIMLAASGHQAWNANVSCLVGDMFPRRVIGSVSGFAGMISAFGGMGLLFLAGKVVSWTGGYLPIFIMASTNYLLALVVVHLLAPRLEPANLDVEEDSDKQPENAATAYVS